MDFVRVGEVAGALLTTAHEVRRNNARYRKPVLRRFSYGAATGKNAGSKKWFGIG